MTKKIKIIPSILSKNKTEFIKDWKKVSPYFKYIQVDIMDGEFVKSKNSVTPENIKKLTRRHKIEVHLMVDGVSKYATRWVKLKNVYKIIWHYEANTNLEHIRKINNFLKTKKIKTGLAINPNTSLAKIKNIIPEFDTIQFMGVTPGKQGQRFQSKILPNIKALRYKFPNINIAIDGAVNDKTFPALKKAGANIFCPGSYLQNAASVPEAVKKLK